MPGYFIELVAILEYLVVVRVTSNVAELYMYCSTLSKVSCFTYNHLLLISVIYVSDPLPASLLSQVSLYHYIESS